MSLNGVTTNEIFADALQFLHSIIELLSFSQLVFVQPVDGGRNSIHNLLLVGGGELGGDLLVVDDFQHFVGIVLQRILGLHLPFCSLSSILRFWDTCTIFSILFVIVTLLFLLKMIGYARNCPRLKRAVLLQRLLPESRNASSSVTLQIQHQSQWLHWPQNPYKYICTSASKTSIRNLLSILIPIFSSIFPSLQNLSWYQSHLLNNTQEMAMSELENKDKMIIGETSNTIASAGGPVYRSLSISLKLTREIFLLWQTLLLPLLKTHDLTHVLKEQAPPSTISNKKGGQVPNPDYKIWRKHDQAVLTLINNSLSEAVIFTIVGKKTAKDAWEALNNNYSSRSKSRIMNLQGRLHNIKKENMSLESYIQIMRTIGDEFQACEHNIEQSDLTCAILNGLGQEYNSFYVSINPQLDHLSYEEVITSLNSYDLHISKQIEDKTTKEFPPSANLSQSSQNWEMNNSEGKNRG